MQVIQKLKQVAFLLVCILGGGWMVSATGQNIAMNQLGFLPLDGKVAVIPNSESGEFWLIDANTGSEVLRGPLSQPSRWSPSGDTVKIADFSAFNKPGDYYLRVAGVGKSDIFTIAEGRFDGAIETLARTFFLHRVGVEIEPTYSQRFSRPAANPDLLVYTHPNIQSKQARLSSPRGWYDSGDLNKYTLNSALAAHFLMRSYESHKNYFNRLKLGVPESADAVPDILDEAFWGLDWLLTMQDSDGGVYQRLGPMDGQTAGMPHQQSARRYVLQKSTGTSLVFAAVMAHAARVIGAEKFDSSGRANQFLQAAERAWRWAEANPKLHFVQPPGARSQLYAWTNDTFQDEWLWAAAELFHTTAQRGYLKRAKLSGDLPSLQWQHLGVLGLLALLENPKIPKSLFVEGEQALVAMADDTVKQYWQSAYLVPMLETDFVRGSNYLAVNKAVSLVLINRLFPRVEYRDAARALFDYTLGRNPLGQSFATGLGRRSVSQPRDWISQYDQESSPLPGLLVSGPYASAVENCRYKGKYAALKYSDSWCSSETNSVSLAGSAALLFLAAEFRQGQPR